MFNINVADRIFLVFFFLIIFGGSIAYSAILLWWRIKNILYIKTSISISMIVVFSIIGIFLIGLGACGTKRTVVFLNYTVFLCSLIYIGLAITLMATNPYFVDDAYNCYITNQSTIVNCEWLQDFSYQHFPNCGDRCAKIFSIFELNIIVIVVGSFIAFFFLLLAAFITANSIEYKEPETVSPGAETSMSSFDYNQNLNESALI